MHASQVLIHYSYRGTDGRRFYMRLDFHSRPEEITAAIELRIRFQCVRALVCPPFKVYLEGGKARAALEEAEAVFHQVLEIGVPLHSIAVEPGEPLEFQLSVWQGGLPVAALPQEGWLKLITTKPSDGWT